VDCEVKKEPATSWTTSPQEEARTDPVDSTTRGPVHPREQMVYGGETVGTVWQNYILRGTQIDSLADRQANCTVESCYREHVPKLFLHDVSRTRSCGRKTEISQWDPRVKMNMLSPGDATLEHRIRAFLVLRLGRKML